MASVNNPANALNTWTSPEQTFTTTGAQTIVVNHGLGKIPISWQAVLRCKNSQHGYDVGDEIFASYTRFDTTTTSQAYVNSTNFGYVIYRLGIYITPKSGVVPVLCSGDKWKIVFYALYT